TLLSIDEKKLPETVRSLRMELCHYTPWPADPVIVAIPEGTARSRIISPSLLPTAVRSKFATAIEDVATTGNSGSGVFDARSSCLLGIMSRKIVIPADPDDPQGKSRDLAKYFVPSATIAEFIPPEYQTR